MTVQNEVIAEPGNTDNFDIALFFAPNRFDIAEEACCLLDDYYSMMQDKIVFC